MTAAAEGAVNKNAAALGREKVKRLAKHYRNVVGTLHSVQSEMGESFCSSCE